ncbi:hypothetical protein TRVL_05373 [Trypanosoma vivax]|nr:hypothetical protein TRVL_05373 [Trypanosoma vivax]
MRRARAWTRRKACEDGFGTQRGSNRRGRDTPAQQKDTESNGRGTEACVSDRGQKGCGRLCERRSQTGAKEKELMTEGKVQGDRQAARKTDWEGRCRTKRQRKRAMVTDHFLIERMGSWDRAQVRKRGAAGKGEGRAA